MLGRSSASSTPTAFGQNQKHKVPRARFCRRPYACVASNLSLPVGRRSVACPRSAAQRQQDQAPRYTRHPPCAGFAADARQIVSKLHSYGLRPESKTQSPPRPFLPRPYACVARNLSLPVGRRSVACPRSAAQRQQDQAPRYTRHPPCAGFATGARTIVSMLLAIGPRPASTLVAVKPHSARAIISAQMPQPLDTAPGSGSRRYRE